jgi:1-deoxyxylulose-5-phosphate synthase
MNRRSFLCRTTAMTGAVALGSFPYHLFASEKKKYATDRVKLGPKGVEVSRLAMGTGTNGSGGSSNQSRQLGVRGLADHFRLAYDNGVHFWDVADQYGTHPHVKEALKRVPRDKVVILTKTHATTSAQMKADLDRFRREMGVDYIDILLLHNMQAANWPTLKRGAMDVISEACEKKIVRTRGVSCHTIDALRAAAEEPWVEVDLARINPAGAIMDADVPTVTAVLRKMKASGKGIIGMKIFGAGQLIASKGAKQDRTDESLQFAMGLGCVDCFTIGSENAAEFLDLTKKIPAASVRG